MNGRCDLTQMTTTTTNKLNSIEEGWSKKVELLEQKNKSLYDELKTKDNKCIIYKT